MKLFFAGRIWRIFFSLSSRRLPERSEFSHVYSSASGHPVGSGIFHQLYQHHTVCHCEHRKEPKRHDNNNDNDASKNPDRITSSTPVDELLNFQFCLSFVSGKNRYLIGSTPPGLFIARSCLNLEFYHQILLLLQFWEMIKHMTLNRAWNELENDELSQRLKNAFLLVCMLRTIRVEYDFRRIGG